MEMESEVAKLTHRVEVCSCARTRMHGFYLWMQQQPGICGVLYFIKQGHRKFRAMMMHPFFEEIDPRLEILVVERDPSWDPAAMHALMRFVYASNHAHGVLN